MLLKSLQFLHSTTGEKLPSHLTNSSLKLDLPMKKIWPQIGLDNHIEDCPSAIKKIPNLDKTKKYRIGFSSNRISGLWDIATMSMRGVVSCMHWRIDTHSRRLVGSLLDPMLGVIYLTDGTQTDYGCSFVKRAVVRFIIVNQKPRVLIERIYTSHPDSSFGNYLNRDNFPMEISNLFKEHITKCIPKKHGIEIISTNDIDYIDKISGPINTFTGVRPWWVAYIPRSEFFDKIPQEEKSCVDSGIAYNSYPGDVKWLEMTQ